MRRQQAAHRARIKEAVDPERGLVLVHTGNGKGKSTSAFGIIVRALGWGKRVGVVQFIKGKAHWKTGERQFFSRLDEPIVWHTMGDGFTWDTQDEAQDTKAAVAAFDRATDMMTCGDFDLIVLDEINIARFATTTSMSMRSLPPSIPVPPAPV